MTATAPARTGRRPAWSGRRHCTVYGIYTRTHPGPPAVPVELGYVGQTVQELAERLAQHAAAQPWADLIVQIVALDSGCWTAAELDQHELRHIRILHPRYNIVGNRRHPGRTTPWVALQERHARDDAAGRPRWQAPAGDTIPVPARRPSAAATRTRPPRRTRGAGPARPAAPGGWRRRTGRWAGVWLLALAGADQAAAQVGVRGTAADWTALVLGTAATLATAGLARRWTTGRTRSARRS